MESKKSLKSNKWGKLAVKNGKLPRKDIYAILREQFLENTNTRSRELAELLDVTPQMCSTYATGTDKRTPPWWAILRLCQMLKCEIVISPTGVRIVGSSESKEDAA